MKPRRAIGLVACIAPAAWAQTAQPAPEPSLRPVVVTAVPGLAAAAFDTPASVDVVPGEVLRNGQLGINLSESLVRVPGVVALNRQNYAQDLQVSIRGFGARATFGVRGLRLYADGIPATAPDGQGQISHFDLASADRIEVLRGPFSSLYGNSSGGVISIFTADGQPGVQAEAATAFGSHGVRRHNARIAGEQGPWNYHLSAVRFATDGFRQHSAAQRTGVNGKFRLKATADTTFTLVVNGMDMPGVQDPLGLARAEYEANPRQATPAAIQFDTRKSVDQLQAGAILDHKLDAANSFKLTAWRGRRGTEQFQSIPVGPQAAPTHPGGVIDLARDYQGADARWTHKTRLAGGPFTLTAGAMADDLREHRRGLQNFAGATLGVQGALRRDEDNRVRNFDQYLHAHWASERVSVSGGVRQARVHFRSRDNYIAAGNGDDSGSARHRATTPAAGVVFHASDTLNLYAAYGQGFETPTFNELSYRPDGQPGLNFALKSARSRQREIGLKAEPAPQWRINAALFDARTADEIVVATNAGGRSTFQNAASTRRRGAELALSGRWGEAWSLAAAATWLQAEYAGGERLPGIPRMHAFAELGWRHKPWGLEAALEWRHQGRIAVDDRNSDFAPRADVLGLRLGLEQRVGHWRLREFVRIDNALDRRYVGSVIVNEGNRRFFESAPVRTWLAGISAATAF